MTNEERTSAGRPLDERSQDGQTVDEPSADGEGVSDYFSTEKIFRRVHATAENEIDHSVQVLFMSGLAAGLSLGPSFVCSAAFAALVPLEEGAELVGNLLDPLGFLLVIGGHYQLFIEKRSRP